MDDDEHTEQPPGLSFVEGVRSLYAHFFLNRAVCAIVYLPMGLSAQKTPLILNIYGKRIL